MIDPILVARLDTLEQNLLRVENNTAWVATRREGLRLADELSIAFQRSIGMPARTIRIKEIKEIRDALEQAEKAGGDASETLKAAWIRYTELYKRSQEIFGECLEFIGGLAFRDRGLDERICQVADELIRDFARPSTGKPWDSLTVPALKETLTTTLARIIRLRFAEWTIWTLPFTAHEFGHVVIGENDDLPDFIAKEVGTLLNHDPRLRPMIQDAADDQARERARQRAEHHIHEFVADAFATYIMGPAYACAAILMRFNPATAYDDDDEHPADARRACIVLDILKRMNAPAGRPSPYRDVIEELDRQWTEALERTHPKETLDPADRIYLQNLVTRIWEMFMLTLISGYPYKGKDGWPAARKWDEAWRQQIEANADQLTSEVPHDSKLRDALNAAWLFRLFMPEHKEITKAAHELCNAIIETRGQPAPQNIPTPNIKGG